jgi:hypothetical protein
MFIGRDDEIELIVVVNRKLFETSKRLQIGRAHV